jgi:hypothetical protein
VALFNESLEGRFARLVGALHSIKGPNPVPQVAPEIVHVIPISDEHERRSHLYLEGTTRYSSGLVSVTGDATHFGVVQFLNPVGSGILCTIESAVVAPASNNNIKAFLTGAAIATSPASSFPLDTRETPTKKSALTNFINATAIVGVSGNEVGRVFNGFAFQATIEMIEARGIVLGPGGIITFFSQAVATQVAVQLVHRERAANPAELRAP